MRRGGFLPLAVACGVLFSATCRADNTFTQVGHWTCTVTVQPKEPR
jgi:hypothetical protein